MDPTPSDPSATSVVSVSGRADGTTSGGCRNGRVLVDDDISRGKLMLFDRGDSSLPFNQQALQGVHEHTRLNQVFFSPENEQWIQNALRRRVYDKSEGQHLIGEQDRTQIQIVMRSVFLQHAQHLGTDIKGQILALNEHVLEYCVPTVYSNLLQHLSYKQDVSCMPVPLEHAQSASLAGLKTYSLFHNI